MQRIKELILMDLTEDGQFRVLKLGENDVRMIVLTTAPDGAFYSVGGDTPGRFFVPMHMISGMEMAKDVTTN